jgi:di/tricarboxylate transporter
VQEIALVLGVLGATVILFVSEKIRVDVVALIVLVSLAWLGLVTPQQAVSGFASNAVMSMIGVMILGYGIDRSGVMSRITRPIIDLAGSSERRLVALVSGVVGVMSGFMQNIGAAALFLPAMIRISKRTQIPVSRLLMPMGFAAILGGTLTMVGSGPLIILNDLLAQGGLNKYGLFDVMPIGLILLASGVGYFLLFGRYVLPVGEEIPKPTGTQKDLRDTWDLPNTVFEYLIPEGSPLVGKTREEAGFCANYKVNLIALAEGDDVTYSPWRYTRFVAGQMIAVLGERDDVATLARDLKLRRMTDLSEFEELREGTSAGFAEIVIPPRSRVVGKTVREIAMRKNHVVEPVVLLSGKVEQRGDFSDVPLEAGDALIVHGRWDNIKSMGDRRDYVLVTPVEAMQMGGTRRPIPAVLCLVGALVLAILGFPLSISLLTGAAAMVVLGVLSMDEAYRAIDWRVVFLLAGLIPLGLAMEQTGAAEFIAEGLMTYLQEAPAVLILVAIAALSTVFSLFMSNVAATVVLVPLVIIMGNMLSLDPRGLCLLVAVCASNSFLLPTHQVNAMLMSPGGYRNSDYLRAGGVMTVLFIIVAVCVIFLFYM